MSDKTLSAPDAFAAMAAERSEAARMAGLRSVRRTIAGVAVALLHVLLIVGLIVSVRVPTIPHINTPREIIFRLIPILHQVSAPVATVQPKKKKEFFFELPTSPIWLPPIVVPREKTPMIDIMGALGAELACGASNYEYLGPVERALCHRSPWELPRNRDVIVLKPIEPPPRALTGAEAATRLRAQAPPCPILLNTPCINDVITGKGGPPH